MSREDIVALFARRDEAWAKRDAAALTATHAEDAVAESPMQGRISGRARIGNVYTTWFRSFPDLTFTSRELIIDGSRVAQFFHVRGTQTAPFGGIPATGRRIEVGGAWLYTIGTDGLIAQDERVYDVTGILVQLGMLKGAPADPPSSARPSAASGAPGRARDTSRQKRSRQTG
ncbi:MAG: ester cyclase [Acidobacteriota bacterium]